MVKAPSSEELTTDNPYRTPAKVSNDKSPVFRRVNDTNPYRTSAEVKEEAIPVFPMVAARKDIPSERYKECPKCKGHDLEIRYCAGWAMPTEKQWIHTKRLAIARNSLVKTEVVVADWNKKFSCQIEGEHLHTKCKTCTYNLGSVKCSDAKDRYR